MRLTKLQKEEYLTRIDAVAEALNDIYNDLYDTGSKHAETLYDALGKIDAVGLAFTPPKERRAGERFCREYLIPLIDPSASVPIDLLERSYLLEDPRM